MSKPIALWPLLTGLWLHAAEAANWTVGPALDGRPGVGAASLTNEDGHTLIFWPLNGDGRYRVVAELHLAEGWSFAREMPRYRIDDGPEIATEALWGRTAPNVAVWILWTADRPVIAAHASLRKWLGGGEVVIAFTTADGVQRTTRFPLDGAAPALLAATRLTAP